MDYRDIKPGLILSLKKERREDYGVENTCAAYLVTAIKERKGYKVPYIQCGQLYFKPTDFDRVVGSDFKALEFIAS